MKSKFFFNKSNLFNKFKSSPKSQLFFPFKKNHMNTTPIELTGWKSKIFNLLFFTISSYVGIYAAEDAVFGIRSGIDSLSWERTEGEIISNQPKKYSTGVLVPRNDVGLDYSFTVKNDDGTTTRYLGDRLFSHPSTTFYVLPFGKEKLIKYAIDISQENGGKFDVYYNPNDPRENCIYQGINFPNGPFTGISVIPMIIYSSYSVFFKKTTKGLLKDMIPFISLSVFSTFGVYAANIYFCVINKKTDDRVGVAIVRQT
eukprot:TRINITY_DN18036_c0_g1_i1.p1 TRINITY_DN18036_c0_g1~~TRINITY_DN18036_c0_g1_i1.p1  ORF type:complete len:257 (-),score=53.50 TRINITY_DN18036_c0_g1_i1:41-811(-)